MKVQMTITIASIKQELERCLAAQADAVALWHKQEPENVDVVEAVALEHLEKLILAQHLKNFALWHVEDIARRKDVGPEVIADCKYRIDGLNQRRNDYMEKVDECLVGLLMPLLPQSNARINTESLGMAIDRMSILALKIYHMAEQAERIDVDDAHRESCRSKLAVLEEQRRDLVGAVLELIDEYAAGTKQPKAYYQFKMYNDPSLNPQLYTHNGTGE